MSLGIVLHTVIGYLPEGPWDLQDTAAIGVLWSVIFDAIHLFRMPAFYVIAGFFGAFLWRGRGARVMLVNRVRRIGLPLLCFLLLMWPLIHFAVGFGTGVIEERPSPLLAGAMHATEGGWLPTHTVHLWFLYMLLWVTLLTAGLVTLATRFGVTCSRLIPGLRRAGEGPWRSLAVFGVLNTVYFAPLGWEILPSDGGWFPDPLLVCYYLSCYGLGWIFFTSKLDLSTLQERAWTLLVIGLLCVVIRETSGPVNPGLPTDPNHAPDIAGLTAHVLRVLVSSIGLVAFTRGFAGLFMRYANSGSPGWRYLSDASYWVYLMHLPLTILIPPLLIDWGVHSGVQCLVAMVLVTVICVATYDLGVRTTRISTLLNGRQYRRYSLRLSGVVSLLSVGWLVHGVVVAAPPETPRSAWRGGASAQALLPQETVTHPAPLDAGTLTKVNVSRCVQVRRYTLCPQKVSHSEASEVCKALNSQLVELEDASEDKDVSTLAWKLSRRPFWLGLSDAVTEGQWRWASKAEQSYGGWAEGEPNDWGGREDCAVSNFRAEGAWNDTVCDGRNAVICERVSP